MTDDELSGSTVRLRSEVDPKRDHARDSFGDDSIVVVGYQDFLCPYCRRLRQVFRRLRDAFDDRLVYVFRHFPNERANPGAELAARASEAAALQGRFFEMHDAIFDRPLPVGRAELVDMARAIGLDIPRFERDLESDVARARVERDVLSARANGISGTPTLFVDGLRYDGAWDFHSLLEALERPFAARVHRSARTFASLPTSAGLVLLVAAVMAALCANSPLAGIYERLMNAELAVGPAGHPLSLTLREWFAEGLLSIFFLLVGLEIRREVTTGPLASWRAALLPIVAAVGGVAAPAFFYLAWNRGSSAHGWSIPTATDIAFTLALLAVLGSRIPTGLRVFVAALAVVDDILSVLILAIFYPRWITLSYGPVVIGCLALLFAFNRARVYARWPYVAGGLALWLSLHALGVDAALAGVLLAFFLPTRPAPKPTPLLAQAATALAALEHAESEARRAGRRETGLDREPVWDWAARNLSAAAERILSPADRIERAVAPWSAYVILPVFAFSAAGVTITTNLTSPNAWQIFAGVAGGLVIGKPVGVLLASGAAIAARLAVAPEGVTKRDFVGAACLCGVGDTLALLMADRAFSPDEAAVAKLAVVTGSVLAAIAGVLVLRGRRAAATPA